MKILLPLAALAASFPLVPAAALAPVRTEIVHFADLTLASNDGRAVLDRRIARAADTVCGAASDLDLAGQNDLRRCRTATVAAARQSLTQVLAARRSVVTVAANR